MPGKLVLRFKTENLGEFTLDKDVITVGRKPDNDIQINNLAVSGHHAKVLNIMEDSYLQDLDSTNGTFVNGKQIAKHPLKNGDIISIGKHELHYVNYKQKRDDDDDDFEKTVIISAKKNPLAEPRPDTLSMNREQEQAGNTGEAVAARKPRKARLQLLNGKHAGKGMDMEKPSIKLGKPGLQVAVINRREDGDFIVAVEQGEGIPPIRVNGETLDSRVVKLNNHDVIELVKLKIEYYLVD